MVNDWKCAASWFWLRALKQAQAHLLPFGNKGQVIKYVTGLSEAIYDNSLIQFNKSLESILSRAEGGEASKPLGRFSTQRSPLASLCCFTPGAPREERRWWVSLRFLSVPSGLLLHLSVLIPASPSTPRPACSSEFQLQPFSLRLGCCLELWLREPQMPRFYGHVTGFPVSFWITT